MHGLHSRLKDIISEKKLLNLGEISPFFHLVATSVADMEGVYTHGFDNAFRQLLDKGNWNKRHLANCGRTKPQLLLKRFRRDKDYHIYAFPLMDGEPVVDFQRLQSNMDFVVWDPARMSNLVRLSGILDFIPYALLRGDTADKALVDYAQEVSKKIMDQLAEQVEILEDNGPTLAELKAHAIEQLNSADIG